MTSTTPTSADRVATRGRPAGRRRGPGRAGTALLVALAAAGLVLLGAAAGALGAREPVPGDASAEAGFARDMSTHHGQAVEMAMAVLPRTDDPLLAALARDIALTQQAQIGWMQGWLAEWGLPPTGPGPRMAWMAGAPGHEGHDMLLPDGRMPGMASPADLASLRALPPDSAEVRFLELMIPHHVAGVEMAQAGVDLMDDPEAVALARTMIESQQSELAVLGELLGARGVATEGTAAGAATPGEETAGGHAAH